MDEKQNTKEHFEAILGRKLLEDLDDFDGDGVVVLRERTGTYFFSEGFVTSREIGTKGKSTKACGKSRIVDVSGIGITGKDGKIEFLLSDFFCSKDISFEHPVNFLATVRSKSPIFLTFKGGPTSDRRDVKITVFSWNSSGAPAANISFDWKCRVPFSPVID